MITFENEKRTDLMKRVGSISQIAGLRRYRLSGGLADGVEAVDVRTGAGLCYTVLPGRCMDIAWADFKGSAFSYISRTGVVSPSFYDPRGMEWLKGFFAGLLTTCGLSNVGWPCTDVDSVIGERPFGLHGRISNTPADAVSVDSDWADEERYVMRLKGIMREATVHGENLTLRREISSELGKNTIHIHDEVENCGYSETPLMILYHINLGYPLLSADSVLLSSASRVIPGSPEATAEASDFGRFSEPCHGYAERLYFHELAADDSGHAHVGLVNDRLGFGVALSIQKDEFPELTEWKVMKETEYVVGIEPGTNRSIGRAEARAANQLAFLKPGERRRFDLSLEVLDGAEAISKFRQKVQSIVE